MPLRFEPQLLLPSRPAALKVLAGKLFMQVIPASAADKYYLAAY